jgi:hypothetical protein
VRHFFPEKGHFALQVGNQLLIVRMPYRPYRELNADLNIVLYSLFSLRCTTVRGRQNNLPNTSWVFVCL